MQRQRKYAAYDYIIIGVMYSTPTTPTTALTFSLLFASGDLTKTDPFPLLAMVDAPLAFQVRNKTTDNLQAPCWQICRSTENPPGFADESG